MAFDATQQLEQTGIYTKEENMENSTKKYYNRANLLFANKEVKGEYKMLKLCFQTYDKEAKEPVQKYAALFLNSDNNERNQETLQHLGCTNVPDRVDFDSVEKLEGLGTRVVDLVAEDNEQGYENVKFINAPKFGVRVFDTK